MGIHIGTKDIQPWPTHCTLSTDRILRLRIIDSTLHWATYSKVFTASGKSARTHFEIFLSAANHFYHFVRDYHEFISVQVVLMEGTVYYIKYYLLPLID